MTQDALSHDFTAELLEAGSRPCLSLYQPTHRPMSGRRQDTLRFRNLVNELELSLRKHHPKRKAEPLLQPFRALADDAGFWRGQMRDGLAVFGSADLFRVYQVPRAVPEFAVVASSFHVKPLIRILQSIDRYYVLGIERDRVCLFEGDRDRLEELHLPEGFPRTSGDVAGGRERQRFVGARASHAGQIGVVHGAGSESAVVDAAMTRFYRAVDQEVLARFLQPVGRPLLLVGLPENVARYRAVSRNPLLLDVSVDASPRALSLEQLRGRAWQVIEPGYLARLHELVSEFRAKYEREQGDRDVAKIARSAVAGRVAMLLVDAACHLPGHLELESGAIRPDILSRPDVDDLLDDIAQQVLVRSGDVVIVPSARMPTDTGLAAIYRF